MIHLSLMSASVLISTYVLKLSNYRKFQVSSEKIQLLMEMVFLIKILSLGSDILSIFQNCLQNVFTTAIFTLIIFKVSPVTMNSFTINETTHFEGLLRLMFIPDLKYKVPLMLKKWSVHFIVPASMPKNGGFLLYLSWL